MSERGRESEPRTPGGGESENPTDEQLDVEGPNESAPGHEPSTDDGEADGGASRPASDG